MTDFGVGWPDKLGGQPIHPEQKHQHADGIEYKGTKQHFTAPQPLPQQDQNQSQEQAVVQAQGTILSDFGALKILGCPEFGNQQGAAGGFQAQVQRAIFPGLGGQTKHRTAVLVVTFGQRQQISAAQLPIPPRLAGVRHIQTQVVQVRRLYFQ